MSIMKFIAIVTLLVVLISNSEISSQCTPHYTFTGEAADDAFGWSVSSAGDFDGDGYDDIVIGAWRSDAGGPQSGKVYVYSGQSGATLFEITGEQPGNELGGATSGVSSGDFNGDGYDDIIMGARFYSGVGSNSGRAYVFLGGPGPYPVSTGASSADMIISGEATGDRLGFSTSNAGDVNGDSYDDFIIGATQDYSGGTAVGRAYVFFGRTGPLPLAVSASAADITLIGEAAGYFFGLSVSGAGDVNSDGFDDMLVGAPQSETSGTGGRAYIFLGGSGPFPKSILASDADVIFSGESTGDIFGVSSSCAGDINADGHADVVVGASFNDAGGSNAGRAYVFFGGNGAFPSIMAAADADIIFTGELANGWFGSIVSGVADVNCDGAYDLLVSATPWDFASPNDSGHAFLFLGGFGPYPASVTASSADIVFTGEATGDLFGGSTSGAGDVNGDGCNDLIIGAPKNDVGGLDAGRMYVYSCVPPTIVVSLDIKPRSCPNPLNIKNGNKWSDEADITPNILAKVTPNSPVRLGPVVPAAILGTSDFDVSDIDPNSVTLAGVSPSQWNFEDVSTPTALGSEECECNSLGSDGFIDLTLKFDKRELIDSLGAVGDGDTIPITITGLLNDGTPFEGVDCVVIRGNKEESTETAELYGNYPNPFNPSTNISFSLPVATEVTIEIYNLLGQKIVTLVKADYEAGEHIVQWNGRDAGGSVVASGIYFYRLTTGDFVEAKKMLLLK